MSGTKLIQLSKGQFNIGATSLNAIYSNVVLRGMGREITTLKVINGTNPYYDTYNSAIRVMGSVSNIWLRDFTLDCNMANSITPWDLRGITTTAVDGLHLLRLGFKGVVKMGLCIEGDDYVTMDSCNFEGGFNTHNVQSAYVFLSNASNTPAASKLSARNNYFLDGGYNNAGAQCYYLDYGTAIINGDTFKNCDMAIDTRGDYDSGAAVSHISDILIDGGKPTVDDGQTHYWFAISYSSEHGCTADRIRIINWQDSNMHHTEVVSMYGTANAVRMSDVTIITPDDDDPVQLVRFSGTASNCTLDKWYGYGSQNASNDSILLGPDGTGDNNKVINSYFTHSFWGTRIAVGQTNFQLINTDVTDCDGGVLTLTNNSSVATLPNVKNYGGNAGTSEEYIKVIASADLPTPSVNYRGMICRVEGGVGVTDTLYMCMKNAANSYTWKAIATGG